jgi:membrane protein DedA with SNARE-associated domain
MIFHEWIQIWFHWVEVWGYWGVFFLMAMESSIIPVPSEIVMPPAAFWAVQGKMSLSGVILAGTLGSYFGSFLSYWVSRGVGQPFIRKYGKFVFLNSQKIDFAEVWVDRFGIPGVFAARLLPVVRHLISIPAGLLKMSFIPFSAVTLLGAGLWCAVLSWLGREVIGNNPELLQSPDLMISVIKGKMHWFLGGVFVFVLLYFGIFWIQKKLSQKNNLECKPSH